MRMTHQSVLSFVAALAMFFTFVFPAQAQSAMDEVRREEARKTYAAAMAVAKTGPVDVPLASQGTLKLPANYIFIPQPNATQVLKTMGNPGSDPRLQGLVFPLNQDSWFMTVRFEAAGYVKDDDAKDWNADDLLKSYREGTEAANKERKTMGVPELEILGWAEKPAYDTATHRLVWAMSSKERGADAANGQGVNYNTYALGREGYFSLNLVTELSDLPKHKTHAAAMLTALNFDDGKRYADFNASTDRVAEYGLAALVAGAAAKKLGFFALAFAFIAKFAKVGILAAAAIGAGLFKFLGKKKKDAEPVVDMGNGFEAAPPAEPLRAQVADVNPFAKPAETPPPAANGTDAPTDKK
ncbi:MAG TPA: DUF2167 domain-containing protein [Casimicrobium sp.]|nr:DUF2167 domain-containing protein [Casimicrobium sp.]